MRIKEIAFTLSILSVSGCAPSVGLVQIPTPTTKSTNIIQVLDSSPPDQRESRTSRPGAGYIVSYLGDDKFSPNPMTFLRTFLQEGLSERLDGKTVSIASFKVSVSNTPKGSGQKFVNISSPIAVLGSVAANTAISDVVETDNDRMVFCEVEIRVDGKSFKANEMLRSPKAKVEERIIGLVQKSVQAVARDANSLGGY